MITRALTVDRDRQQTTSGALPFKYLPYEPVEERAIAAWQEAVAAACSTPDSRPTAFFSGPTSELVASALVFLLVWQFNPAPPPDAQFAAAIAATAPGVTCRLVPLSALLNTDRLMIVYVSSSHQCPAPILTILWQRKCHRQRPNTRGSSRGDQQSNLGLVLLDRCRQIQILESSLL